MPKRSHKKKTRVGAHKKYVKSHKRGRVRVKGYTRRRPRKR